MSDPELEEAVRQLERVARTGRRPDRFLARAVLLALGRQVGKQGEGSLDPWRERIRKACDQIGDAWEEAAVAELALACEEHIRSVDPRYLDLPDYDYEYTIHARERLEDRLAAARELGLEVPGDLLQGVFRADRTLADRVGGKGDPSMDWNPGLS